MSRPSPRPATAPRPWKRLLLWGLPALVVLAVIGVFVAKAAIDAYLRSDGFRQFVARKAGATLRAEAELAPLNFSGMSVYADGFRAAGGKDAAFSTLQLEQVRAELSLRRFSERVWQVEQFEVARLKVDLTGPRAALPAAPSFGEPTPKTGGDPSTPKGGWLPDRVEVGSALVRDTQLQWAGGSLRGTGFEIKPHEGGWQIAGQGGQLLQGTLPPLDIHALALRYRPPSLFVNSSEFRQPGGGSMQATGEIDFSQRLNLDLVLADIAVAPFLSADWRLRLKGNLSGEVHLRGPLPLAPAGPEVTGSLRLTQGELTALPVLDEIATFTRTQQFRRLNLTRMSGDFAQSGGRLRVTKFLAESEGLICMEGAFTVEREQIDGVFQVGVTPASLQWLPGSQARVFTETRAGYVWAPMRLTGPLGKPTEDLSPRLAAAARGAVLEGVQNAVGETLKTGKDTLKGALDLLLPGGK